MQSMLLYTEWPVFDFFVIGIHFTACMIACSEFSEVHRFHRFSVSSYDSAIASVGHQLYQYVTGMENPCLTFVTPTLLAGDRSLVNVVAHEIAHSWTGNLVTNATWEHFWLNEGNSPLSVPQPIPSFPHHIAC